MENETFAEKYTLLRMNYCFLGIYFPAGDAHTWVCDGLDEVLYQDYDIITCVSGNGEIVKKTKLYTSAKSTDYNSFLHMNWGWDGLGYDNKPVTNNGWYNYNINYTQANGASPNYQYFQTVIYNIHK